MNPRRTSRPGVLINRMRARSVEQSLPTVTAEVPSPLSPPAAVFTPSIRSSLFFLPAR